MLKRFILPAVILSVAIAIFILLVQSKPEKSAIEKPEKIWRVNTVPVVFQNISPEITIYGRVETPRQATLRAAMVADVMKASVLEGTIVEEGQSLVKLDATDIKLLLKQRHADVVEINAQIESEFLRLERDMGLLENENQLLQLADNAVSRAKKLEKSRLASQAHLDDAIANKQHQVLTIKRLEYDIKEHPTRLAVLRAKQAKARALVEQTKVDLTRTDIKAPFNGRIAKLEVTVGDRVKAGDPLLTIYDVSDLEVRAQIPGRHIQQVRRNLLSGQQQTATTILEGESLTFTLKRLSGEIRQDSGGIDGLFQLMESMNTLALGTFVELSLQLSEQVSVIAIPYDSLYELDKVYRINDGYLEAVNVERIGEYQTESGDINLLIRCNELAETDIIVSTQLPNAISGLRVEPFND
ncbi:MAG: HlyD family efflux transporter periplasmic adaptor subunit [Piscirickettsiaceae bacterium]|nr:HlyD family efflux transporter periplasmic adaptor subunit [Piscirickettsiaceae bacterium]